MISPGTKKDLENFGITEEGMRWFRIVDGEHGFVILPTLLHPGKTGVCVCVCVRVYVCVGSGLE